IVFKSVRMNQTVNVALRVVDNTANVFTLKFVVAGMRISINTRAVFNMLPHSRLEFCSRSCRNDHCANVAMAFKQSHYGNLANHPSGRELGSLLSFLVHVPFLAADVRFVNFYMAAQSLKKRA